MATSRVRDWLGREPPAGRRRCRLAPRHSRGDYDCLTEGKIEREMGGSGENHGAGGSGGWIDARRAVKDAATICSEGYRESGGVQCISSKGTIAESSTGRLESVSALVGFGPE